jgi:hypothetical protein
MIVGPIFPVTITFYLLFNSYIYCELQVSANTPYPGST